MPRTIERIIDCHKAATALRNAGKPIWGRTVNIKAILHEDQSNESPEYVAEISNRIGNLIRSSLPSYFFDEKHDEFDYDFVDTIESMMECSVESLAQDKDNGVEPVEMLNGWLDYLYDWADDNRIWLG